MTPNYQQALEQLEAEDFAGALQTLNQVLSESQFAEAYYQRGRTRAKLQDLSGAIVDYTESIRLQPTAEAFLNRGLLYLVRGAIQAAIDDAHHATQIDKLPLAYRLLGKAYTQLGNASQAIVAYKQAAQSYLAQQDKESVRYCIAQVEALQPPAPSAAILRRNPCGIELQPPQRSPLDPAVAQAFLQQVNAKIEQSNYAAARLDLDWLLNLEPNHIPALCLMSKVQAKLGDGQAAIQAIAQALKSDPDNHEIQFQRGIVRLMLGDAHGAVVDFTQLMAQDSSNVQLFTQRGRSYYQLGEFENAFKDYSNAIGITTEDASLYYARAEAQKAMRELDGALTDYQQAATLWFNQGNWPDHQNALSAATSLREKLKQQNASKSAEEARIVRVPIKYRAGGSPVIEATFNGQYKFDVVVDPGAIKTLISPTMAQVLRIQSAGRTWGQLADGRFIEFESGWVQSVAVQSAEINNLQVLIAPQDVLGLLGQDFLSNYHVRILSDEVEFHT